MRGRSRVNIVNDIRLGLRTAASVAFSALALHACQLQAAFDAEGSLDAGVVLEDAEQAPPEDAPEAGALADPSADVPAAAMVREVTVRPQDTLWSIAAAALPPNYANVQQYMLAILQANPHAFANGNINGLIAGSRLRLPLGGAESLPAEAIQEAGRQNSAWGGVVDDELKILVREDNWAPRDSEDQPIVVAEPDAPPETAPVPVADDGEVDFGALESAPPVPKASPSGALEETHRQETVVQDVELPQRSDELRRRDVELRQRDEAIAKLNDDLASLRATLQAERRDWRQQLARWRLAATAGAIAVLVLLIVVVAMWRRRRAEASGAAQTASPPSSQAPPSPEPDDHHFGEPISDHRVKLNLAQANMDLGKIEVAREILEEVRAAGGAAERQEAEALLGRLDAAQS